MNRIKIWFHLGVKFVKKSVLVKIYYIDGHTKYIHVYPYTLITGEKSNYIEYWGYIFPFSQTTYILLKTDGTTDRYYIPHWELI